jgi:hypothetical protein
LKSQITKILIFKTHDKVLFERTIIKKRIHWRFKMNLTHLSDNVLLCETKKLAREEREILIRILWHIREVEKRRLFSKLKFQSINDYLEKELGYSSDQAWRRIAASRLLNEIPEIEEKINSGELNLTNIGLAQALFKKEKRDAQKPFSLEKKKEVLNQISGQSTRQAAKIVWSHSTLPVPEFREQVRALTDEFSEYNFKADKETQEDLERLKGLLAHSHPGMSLSELIKKLSKLGLREWDPTLKIASPRPNPKTAAPRPNPKAAAPRSNPKTAAPRPNSKAEQSRQTWRKAQNKCTHCRSFYALQEDHQIPKAKGGDDSAENMRLLCRNCNQRAAIEHFGIKKMQMFLKSPEVLYIRTVRVFAFDTGFRFRYVHNCFQFVESQILFSTKARPLPGLL